MAEKVRCKFRVYSKELHEKSDQCERPTLVKMCPVQSAPFGKYTPSGNLEMFIINDEVEKQFEVGKEYYVDFTLAE